MRYLGGLFGGTWLTELSGDLGARNLRRRASGGEFRIAYNPANTYWTKPYNVYSKVDTEPERFLDFDFWWGNPVLLNAGEMQWIADNLFVGNQLSSGQDSHVAGRARRFAQHQVANRRVLLLG